MLKIDFDLDIYDEHAIQDGIAAFADIAQIMCAINDGTAECSLKKAVYSPEQTLQEFGNYVLDLSVQKGSGK